MAERCPSCGASLPGSFHSLKVSSVMTANPFTLSPEDPLMRAVELMRLKRIRRIPIVVADNLVGLLAEGDVKRASPSTLSGSEEEFNRVMEDTPISQIMIQSPITVNEDQTLLEAARTLHMTKYGALPVLRAGHLVGILTDSDLLRVLVDLLNQGA